MSRTGARWSLLVLFVAALGWAAWLGYRPERSDVARTEASSPAAAEKLDTDLERRLVAAGLGAERAAHIRTIVDPAREEFERTAEELRRTQDKGWNPALVAARDRLAARLQAELGPLDYDWVLYAYQRANRLVVQSVPAGAELAPGLLPGDVLFSYAGKRIFTQDDVRRARGETTDPRTLPARVARGGVWVDLDLPADALATPELRFEGRLELPEHTPSDALAGISGYGS